MLSRVMNDITFEASFRTIFHRVEAKVYLARVLQRLGEDNEAHKLHVHCLWPLLMLSDKTFREVWLVKWFKKHPHEFGDAVLVQMFTTDIEPAVDPVFMGLGGTKWLNHRKATAKTLMRQARNCRNCRACEPQVKLSLCSKCQHTYYWSVISRLISSQTSNPEIIEVPETARKQTGPTTSISTLNVL